MIKKVCKVCGKEYFRTEKESERDSGCCSPLCESRALLIGCRGKPSADQAGGHAEPARA